MNQSVDWSIVLLPGFVCDEGVWASQLHALKNIAPCVVPDYGLCATIVSMAEHTLSLIKTRRFVLVGHSMGGRVALEVFRKAAERVIGLALLDAGCSPLPGGERGDLEKLTRLRLLHIARTRGMRAMAELWIQPMVHPGHMNTPVYRAILDMVDRCTPEKLAAQIEAQLHRPDARTLLPLINCSTLVVCGEGDIGSSPQLNSEICGAIRASQLKVIENCGHMSTMEKPEEVTMELVHWMRQFQSSPA